jgi:hypothetical protein
VASAAIAAIFGIEIIAEQKAVAEAAGQSLSRSGIASNYDDALARLDQRLEDARRRAAERPREWLVLEAVARLYLARAKLTGSFQDYANAQTALQQAFRVAGPDVGPHMTQALLDFAVHRLAAASRSLDKIDSYAVPPAAEEQAELTAMRGDVGFYHGDYAGALEAYRAADRLSEGSADFRLAIYHSKLGSPKVADKYLAQILLRHPAAAPQSRAFIQMHRGILRLNQGQLDPAMAFFRKADATFPGHWLIEEHIAEVTALKGDLALATRLYRGIVARTGHPEFMDELASLAAKKGQKVLEDHWRSRALAEWRQRLRLFPEAAYGHALDHCLEKEDRACALDLALKNHSARPFGEAKLKLSEALLLNGEDEAARRVARDARRTGWKQTQ